MAAPVRVALAIPAIAGLTLVFGVAALGVGLFDRRGRIGHVIAAAWAGLILRVLGIRVDVDRNASRPDGPALYTANHGSALDIPILLAHLPADFRMVHKRSLYRVPVLGLALWLGGHVPIDRANPFRARRSLEEAARRLREGTSVLTFPEGTRSRDARVQPFKRGSFVLAAQAGVPIVPVSLSGVKQVVPRGLRSLRPGRVRLTVHPPVPTAGRAVDDAAELAEEVRRVVVAGCEEPLPAPDDTV